MIGKSPAWIRLKTMDAIDSFFVVDGSDNHNKDQASYVSATTGVVVVVVVVVVVAEPLKRLEVVFGATIGTAQ